MKGLKSELKRSWIEIKKIKDFPEIYNTILFILINWFIFSPSFDEFFIYYNMNVRKLKQDQLGIIGTISSIISIFGIAIYTLFFRKMEFGTALIMSTIIGIISSLFLIAFILEWNKAININDFTFLII
jgi:hypothetical protein